MRISHLSIALLAVLTFSACQKDDPAPPTNTDLISRNWKITASTGTFPPLPTVDIYAQLQACEKDNILKMSNNGTYTLDEGATKCAPTDPQIVETGNWSFSNNETKLTVMGETFDILSLSATTMTLKQDVAAGGGLPAGTINLTLTAQ
ncbi:MAG: lipocalin family protein [Bacteroidota bacterium]